MCQHCLAKWIRDGAAKHDARQVLPAPALQSNPSTVDGLQELLDAAQAPASARHALLAEIVALGAVSVQELRRADWEGLSAWSTLREFERRRILKYIPP